MLLNEIFLIEKILGTNAIGYHRTRNIKTVQAIRDGGFQVGEKRSLYGAGVYMTYNFDDQQNGRMLRTYGQYVIKSKVNLNGFLIFDQDVAQKVYGDDITFEKQMNMFGISIAPKSIGAMIIQKYNEDKTSSLKSSRAALQFASALFSNKIKTTKSLKGIVFTGDSDGRVMLAYDQAVVIPFAYARVLDLEKTVETVKWNKITAPVPQETSKGLVQVEKEAASFKTIKEYLKRKKYFVRLDMFGEDGDKFHSIEAQKKFGKFCLKLYLSVRNNNHTSWKEEIIFLAKLYPSENSSMPFVSFTNGNTSSSVKEVMENLVKLLPSIEERSQAFLTAQQDYIDYTTNVIKGITDETITVKYPSVNDPPNVRRISTETIDVVPQGIYNMNGPNFRSLMTVKFGKGGLSLYVSAEDGVARAFNAIDDAQVRMIKRMVPMDQISQQINSYKPWFRDHLKKLFGDMD